jgi:CRISPR-associated protein Csb1
LAFEAHNKEKEAMNAFSIEVLRDALDRGSVLRLRLKLEPAGAGGLIYPPTYEQGKHIFRDAWVDGEQRKVVVLDSPQSQANRIELALLDAHRRGDIAYPDIEISIPAPKGEERYSVLQLSHRAYDAALLLAMQGDVPFKNTKVGEAIYGARLERATGLYTHAPIMLALGGWDSHSGGGPLSAKIPRAVTSEIIGVDALPAQRGAVKFDPMDIRKGAGPLYESKDRERMFELDAKAAANNKKKNPSDFGLGNVPAFGERGASIRYAEQTSLVSLAAVRRLRFEGADGTPDAERDRAGQAVVVALGLYGLLAQMESGYFLRSGCDLLPVADPMLEIIGRSLAEAEPCAISAEAAKVSLMEALAMAEEHGLAWRKEVLLLTADDRLRRLVELSRVPGQGDEE